MTLSPFPAARIVVTGMGVVSPLGCGVEPVWSRLLAGQSGIRRLPDAIAGTGDVAIAAAVPAIGEDAHGFDLDRLLSVKDQRKMDRFIHLSLEAASQAIAQAGWSPATKEEQARTATLIGSSIGGFPAIARAVRQFDCPSDMPGARRISPFMIPGFLINLAAGHISIRHGFKGPVGAPVTACAAGAQAIGDGMRLLRSGEADLAVCGAAEACIDPVILAGFVAARAISTGYNDRPGEACRPFDAGRDGLVLGEGAAVLVLETLEHALQRGALPLAEIVGYGTSADAYHITAGLESGEGLQRCMQAALWMAGVGAAKIGYLNAHGSSTPWGDKSELAAIRQVFGPGATTAISSTKSSTGHLLGAAGSLEAVFTILALRDGILPPTLNLNDPDPLAEGLDLIGPQARNQAVQYALSNSAGFGGVNASLVFKKWA